MATVASRPPVIPSNAPTRPGLRPIIRGNLRSILAPKPRLSSSTSTPTSALTSPLPSQPQTSDTAFPTRIPIRKKREHAEVARDELENTDADARGARLRQRCDSGSSTRTITVPIPRARKESRERVAPIAPIARPPSVRPRTNSQESVRTLRNVPVATRKAPPAPTPVPTLAKSCSEPVHGTLSRSERVSAIASITKTAEALRRSTGSDRSNLKTSREREANTQRFPSEVATAPVAQKPSRTELACTRLAAPAPESGASPGRPLAKSLRRTQSSRKLLVDESEDYDRLDKICSATSVEVYEAKVDEVLDEIRRAKEALNEADEAIVRSVVGEIVEDPEVAAEAQALARSPKGRIIMDDLQEIPDMFSDEEEEKDSKPDVQRDEPAPSSSSPIYPDWMYERFEVSIKPMHKHTTMWDVDFEDTYAWQGVLYVKDAQLHPDGRPPLPVLDIDVEWRTVDACTRTLRSDGEPEYAVRFEGAALPGTQILKQMNPARGICTQPMWRYVPPRVRLGGGGYVGGAWALSFWVPVPMRLFKGRDVRRFVLDARVMFVEWGVCTGVGHSERVDVTIEHLRRERDMKIAAKA